MIEASATLVVKQKPKPLELTMIPHDMTAPKGVTIQMPCRASGSPSPTITWLKDGHAMVSPRYGGRSAKRHLYIQTGAEFYTPY